MPRTARRSLPSFPFLAALLLTLAGAPLLSQPGELGPVGTQFWSQASDGLGIDPQANAAFGTALAAGDFDCDGFDDLAVGMPGEDLGGALSAGRILILFSDGSGPAAADRQIWSQNSPGIADDAELGDNFGSVLAAGDFDDDGIDDLAIGSPGEGIESAAVSIAGAVHVLFGSAGGLVTAGQVLFYRGQGLNGSPLENEEIGGVLAAGEWNPLTAGRELAIGVPYHNLDNLVWAGAVILVSDIPGALFDAIYTQDTAGVPGVAEEGDLFGAVLAGGDFDGDGIDELAVGAPFENLQDPVVTDAGSVTVLDFDGDGHVQWLQDDLNPESSEPGDHFGGTLAAADIDADGVDDLAIGAPDEDLGPTTQAGLLHVLYGETGAGLGNSRDQIWLQTVDPWEAFDRFAGALAAGHFSGHSGADLAIGAPDETVDGFSDTGGVNLLFSTALFRDGFESGGTLAWEPTP